MLTKAETDPFTLEIIQSSIVSICGEMLVAMRRTAMSPIIYEVLDMATGILDADGRLASAGAGLPFFVAGLDKTTQYVITKCARAGIPIEEGDIFISNDPYYGGVTHLSDCTFVMPVFADGVIVAWTANMAHWNDIGGMVPGSMSNDATQIFQEGLRLPTVKLVSRGEINRGILDIMTINSRMPDFLEGDLWAAIAAARLGERRIKEIVSKYGPATVKQAIDRYMDYGEQLTLAGLRDLPKGRFEHEQEMDDGTKWKCAIEIRDTEFIVEAPDNPQNTTPFNISRDSAEVAAKMIVKTITDSSPICNDGNFRPLKFITQPGTIFDPIDPAPQGMYAEVLLRLFDTLWHCLAVHMPERLPSGHYASVCAVILGGKHPDTGRTYALIEPEVGGWGADRDHDGATAQFTAGHGETLNCPAEITEARNGFIVDRMELNPEPGGEGRHRGGKGIVLDYRIRSESAFFTSFFGHTRIPPWSLMGGLEGSTNYIEIIRANGARERHAVSSGVPLTTGDVIRIVSGNGAGYGNPAERSLDAIRDDLRNGYLTKERALEIYPQVRNIKL